MRPLFGISRIFMKKIPYRLACYFESIAIFLCSMAAFTYGLFGRELIGFETRFGLFAQEMLKFGPGFFPTTYGQPYPDYPALHTWLIYLVSLPFGHLTTLSAILPSAVACSVTLVLVYFILIRFDRAWALAAVLLSFLTFQLLSAGRSLTMDSLVMLMSMWAFYVAQRAPSTLKGCSWHQVWLMLPLIIGFAIRGPIGFVLPAAVVGVALLSQHGFKAAWHFGLQALGVLLLLFVLLLFAAYHAGGWTFIKDVVQMQILGRMGDGAHRYQTMAYFTDAFANYALSFELALLTVILFAKNIFKAETFEAALLRQCVFWVLVVMIGMSIPGVRKIRYIMPIVPALLILASFWWYQTKECALKSRVLSIVNYFLLGLPFICLVLVTAFIVVTHLKAMDVNAHYFSAYFLLSLLALSSAYILFNHPKTWGLTKPLRVLTLGALSFWVVIVFVIDPVTISLNRVTPFVSQVLRQLPLDHRIAFYQMNRDGEAIQFQLAAGTSVQPLFVQTLTVPHAENLWFITTEKLYQSQTPSFLSQVSIIQEGRLGHQKVVVFALKAKVGTLQNV